MWSCRGTMACASLNRVLVVTCPLALLACAASAPPPPAAVSAGEQPRAQQPPPTPPAAPAKQERKVLVPDDVAYPSISPTEGATQAGDLRFTEAGFHVLLDTTRLNYSYATACWELSRDHQLGDNQSVAVRIKSLTAAPYQFKLERHDRAEGQVVRLLPLKAADWRTITFEAADIAPEVRAGLRRVCVAIDRVQAAPDKAEFDLRDVAIETR